MLTCIINLQKREIILVNKCFMRKYDLETIYLLHWLIAGNLWELALSCFGLHWVMPNFVSETSIIGMGRFFWKEGRVQSFSSYSSCHLFIVVDGEIFDEAKASIE